MKQAKILHNKIGYFLRWLFIDVQSCLLLLSSLLTVQREVESAQIIIKASTADACIKK
jgi:hypothetical protein